MLDCWSLTTSCALVGSLSAAARAAAADLAVVSRQIGFDAETLALAGWTIAALLYLRLHLERLRRQARARDQAGSDGAVPDDHGDAEGPRPASD